jgi:hypothetical protein
MPEYTHIKNRIHQHGSLCFVSSDGPEIDRSEADLLGFIIAELAEAERRGESKLNRLAHALLEQVNTIKENQKKIMIGNDIIEASASRFEKDVHDLIAALPGSTTPSTADTVVTGLLGRIDGASTAMEAALKPTGTPPAPPTP